MSVWSGVHRIHWPVAIAISDHFRAWNAGLGHSASSIRLLETEVRLKMVIWDGLQTHQLVQRTGTMNLRQVNPS